MDKPTAIAVFNNLSAKGYWGVSLQQVDGTTFRVSYSGQISTADLLALAAAVPTAQITATGVTIN